MNPKPLSRKKEGSLWLGICSGISEKTNIPTLILRIAALVLQIQYMPYLIILYIFGYYLLPSEDSSYIDTDNSRCSELNSLDQCLSKIDQKLAKLEEDISSS